jgi:hypothetical protein
VGVALLGGGNEEQKGSREMEFNTKVDDEGEMERVLPTLWDFYRVSPSCPHSQGGE